MRLVADIGGTNARFALLDDSGGLSLTKVLAVADYPDLAAAMQGYLQQTDSVDPAAACVAVACPADQDLIQFTNSPWQFRVSETRLSMALPALYVINDYTAQALALPLLRPGELRQIGPGEAQPERPKLVLGPGTGLGVSGLVHMGEHWQSLAGEGGHIGFSPNNEQEDLVHQALRRRYGRTSAERLLCGQGIVELYEILHRHAPQSPTLSAETSLPAPDIVSRALADQCPVCRQVVDLFCAVLGDVAGDLAMVLGATGGVYLTGGILPRFADTFAASPFRARFEAKGRLSGFVKPIPTYLITAETPALRGCAAYLARC